MKLIEFGFFGRHKDSVPTERDNIGRMWINEVQRKMSEAAKINKFPKYKSYIDESECMFQLNATKEPFLIVFVDIRKPLGLERQVVVSTNEKIVGEYVVFRGDDNRYDVREAEENERKVEKFIRPLSKANIYEKRMSHSNWDGEIPELSKTIKLLSELNIL